MKEKKLGPNFEIRHIMPPWDIGTVVPPHAFREYPKRLIEIGAIRHTFEDPTVEVALTEGAVDRSAASQSELLSENAELTFEVNSLKNKIAVEKARAERFETQLREAAAKNTELESELSKYKDTISELNAENNRLRLEKPRPKDEPPASEPASEAAATVPPTTPETPAPAPQPGGNKPNGNKPNQGGGKPK